MKNILSIIILTFSLASLTAQVGVERSDVRADGIMDFPANATKGILLPKVDNTNSLTGNTADGGAIAFNLTENRIEFYNTDPSVLSWVPMTETSTNNVMDNEHSGTTTFNEGNGDGVIIEAGNLITDNREGVLKLSSNSKALILPQVPDASELPSPKPGTICYDMASNSIAVFNGTEWSFWN